MALSEQDLVDAALAALGMPLDLLARRQRCAIATELVTAETGATGKPLLLTPEAAAAWAAMKQAAAADGIALELVSAFRTLERQSEIIRDKLARGLSFDTILTLSAAPGYSEHHTGCAVDINTPGCEAQEEEFENTAAFGWLTGHAADFGFQLSYPRGNTLGFIYEPWHWFYRPVIIDA